MNTHSFQEGPSYHSNGTSVYIYSCKLLLVLLLMGATGAYGQRMRPRSIEWMNTVEGRAHAFDIGKKQLMAIETLYAELHPAEPINWTGLGGPRAWVKREWEHLEPLVVAVLRGEHKKLAWEYGALIAHINPAERVCDALYTRLQEVYETATARGGQFTRNDHIAFMQIVSVLGRARDIRAKSILHELIQCQCERCSMNCASVYLRALRDIADIESLDALQKMPLRKTNEGIDRLATDVENTIERKYPRAPSAPNLQRVKVLNSRIYVFDFDVPRGPQVPALVEMSNVSQHNTAGVAYYYLFGVARGGVSTNCSPLRWDITEGMVFCTYQFPRIHQRVGPMLLRYPRNALISGPDNGRDCLDRSKLDDRSTGPFGRPAPNYGGLGPIGAAYMGIEGWKVGDEPMQSGLHISSKGIPVVHYDIRALDDARVELYMTVNGQLSQWLFDGEKWTLKRNYPVEISGPFLVCNEGAALVAERDGHWCLIENLDGPTHTVTPIIERRAEQPLVLIEDVAAQKNYFESGGLIFNSDGKEIIRLKEQDSPVKRIQEAARAIRRER